MTSPVAVPAERLKQRRAVRGLYAVTPDGLDDDDLLAACDAVLAGGAGLLQYRNKTADALTRLRQASALRALTRQRQALLVINDDPTLAALVEADGVHLGRADAAVAEVRSQFPHLLVGASCYDQLTLGQAAAAAGADYLAFGAMAASPTKPDAVTAPRQLLGAARVFGLPVVAIGGITSANAPQWITAGADALAVITALFHPAAAIAAAAGTAVAADGPPAAVRTAARTAAARAFCLLFGPAAGPTPLSSP